MKKIILSTLLFSKMFFTNGQEIKITWADELKTNLRESTPNVLFNNGKFIYASVGIEPLTFFKKSKISPAIIRFDADMKLIKRYDYEPTNENLIYHGTYFLGENFFILTSVYDENSKMRIIYAQKVGISLEPDGNSMEMLSFSADKKDDLSYRAIFSEDSSKFCIMAIKKAGKEENMKIAFKVYDSDFKPVLEKQLEVQSSQDNSKIVLEEMVNNKGEVYLLYKEFTNEKNKETIKNEKGEEVPGYKLTLNKYANKGDIKVESIEPKEKYFTRYFLTSDHTSNPLLFIPYYEGEEAERYGIMFFKFDNVTGKTTLNTIYKIPDDFAKRMNETELKVNDKTGFRFAYSVTDFKIYDDQSMSVILEKNISYKVSSQGGSHTVFYSNGILVMNLDKDGNTKWLKLIPKIQGVNGSMLLPYFYHSTMFYKNMIYIFYNDELKNADYDIINAVEVPKTFSGDRKTNSVMVAIDNAGNMKKSIFATTSDTGINIEPSIFKQISPNKMVIGSRHISSFKLKMGIVNFQ